MKPFNRSVAYQNFYEKNWKTVQGIFIYYNVGHNGTGKDTLYKSQKKDRQYII